MHRSSEAEEIRCAKEHVERLGCRVVGLAGHSKGATTALLYSAKHADIPRQAPALCPEPFCDRMAGGRARRACMKPCGHGAPGAVKPPFYLLAPGRAWSLSTSSHPPCLPPPQGSSTWRAALTSGRASSAGWAPAC